jgi:hypothetical protein
LVAVAIAARVANCSIGGLVASIELRCSCGQVRGTVRDVTPNTVNHCICYCSDCRAFVQHLGRDELLTPGGGVRIVQVAPARVTLDARDKLACLRLTPKGMFRFYAACCRSPIANALSPAWPFAGLSGAALEASERELGVARA